MKTYLRFVVYKFDGAEWKEAAVTHSENAETALNAVTRMLPYLKGSFLKAVHTPGKRRKG